MNTPIEDFKDIINASGYATFGIDFFIGDLPDKPDSAIVIFDIVGLSPELNYEWERPAMQLLARGSEGSYMATLSKIYNISKYLHGRQETRNNTRYALINQEGSISYLGKDKENRPLFSTRFQLQRTTA